MPFPLSALIVAIPTYLYAWLVRNVDRYEKEPVKYLIAAFLWGAIPAVVIAAVFQLVFAVPVLAILGEGTAANLVNIAIFGPISEEIIKGIAVGVLYVWRRREFDGWVDGIVYGSTVGFGFAYVENLLYLSSAGTLSEWSFLFFVRVIVFGFMHGFWTGLVGIGFGMARHTRSDFGKALLIAAGLAAAILGHAIHNGTLTLTGEISPAMLCITGFNYLLIMVLMIVLGVIGSQKERALMERHLRDEVPGVINDDVYQMVCKTANAARARLRVGSKSARALTQLASELALKKKQLEQHPDDFKIIAEIDALRAQLRANNPSGPDPLAPVPVAPSAPPRV